MPAFPSISTEVIHWISKAATFKFHSISEAPVGIQCLWESSKEQNHRLKTNCRGYWWKKLKNSFLRDVTFPGEKAVQPGCCIDFCLGCFCEKKKSNYEWVQKKQFSLADYHLNPLQEKGIKEEFEWGKNSVGSGDQSLMHSVYAFTMCMHFPCFPTFFLPFNLRLHVLIVNATQLQKGSRRQPVIYCQASLWRSLQFVIMVLFLQFCSCSSSFITHNTLQSLLVLAALAPQARDYSKNI